MIRLKKGAELKEKALLLDRSKKRLIQFRKLDTPDTIIQQEEQQIRELEMEITRLKGDKDNEKDQKIHSA